MIVKDYYYCTSHGDIYVCERTFGNRIVPPPKNDPCGATSWCSFVYIGRREYDSNTKDMVLQTTDNFPFERYGDGIEVWMLDEITGGKHDYTVFN